MIDKIINEWTYQLDAGYPTKESDYEILRSVLQETNILSEQEIDQTILQAKGVNERQPPSELGSDLTFEPDDVGRPASFYSPEEFNRAIDDYKVKGQEIRNIQQFYEAILKLDESSQLEIKRILQSDIPELQLQTTRYQISGILLTLYDIIMSTIKVTNGEPSELWFAIVFKGDVAGAVSGEDDIESDIIIKKGGETISLKNYKETTFDLGTLPGEASKFLKKFEQLAALITEREPKTASMTRPDVNEVLMLIDQEDIQSDLDQLLNLKSDVRIIQRLQQDIINTLRGGIGIGTAEQLDKYANLFCLKVDEFVKQKLAMVNWWAFIIKGKNILYLRDTAAMIKASTHIDNPKSPGTYLLGPGIANFKGGKLFVNGGSYNISKVWYDKE